MKFLFFYRIVIITVFATVPLALVASDGRIVHKLVEPHFSESIWPMVQDSAKVRKKPESKTRDQMDKPPQDVQDERIKEAERRAIKQVPRSIPKLKPQPVTEGVKIRRPPMSPPKKNAGGYSF